MTSFNLFSRCQCRLIKSDLERHSIKLNFVLLALFHFHPMPLSRNQSCRESKGKKKSNINYQLRLFATKLLRTCVLIRIRTLLAPEHNGLNMSARPASNQITLTCKSASKNWKFIFMMNYVCHPILHAVFMFENVSAVEPSTKSVTAIGGFINRRAYLMVGSSAIWQRIIWVRRRSFIR